MAPASGNSTRLVARRTPQPRVSMSQAAHLCEPGRFLARPGPAVAMSTMPRRLARSAKNFGARLEVPASLPKAQHQLRPEGRTWTPFRVLSGDRSAGWADHDRSDARALGPHRRTHIEALACPCCQRKPRLAAVAEAFRRCAGSSASVSRVRRGETWPLPCGARELLGCRYQLVLGGEPVRVRVAGGALLVQLGGRSDLEP
jgi:hypothetical protein